MPGLQGGMNQVHNSDVPSQTEKLESFLQGMKDIKDRVEVSETTRKLVGKSLSFSHLMGFFPRSHYRTSPSHPGTPFSSTRVKQRHVLVYRSYVFTP